MAHDFIDFAQRTLVFKTPQDTWTHNLKFFGDRS